MHIYTKGNFSTFSYHVPTFSTFTRAIKTSAPTSHNKHQVDVQRGRAAQTPHLHTLHVALYSHLRSANFRFSHIFVTHSKYSFGSPAPPTRRCRATIVLRQPLVLVRKEFRVYTPCQNAPRSTLYEQYCLTTPKM